MNFPNPDHANQAFQDCIKRDEGLKMEKDFTQYLHNFESQIDDLRVLNKSLYEKFEKEAFRNDDLRTLIQNEKQNLDALDEQLSSKIDKFNYLESKIQRELLNRTLSDISLEELTNIPIESLGIQQLLKKFRKATEYLSRLEKNIIRLSTQEELINRKIVELNVKFNSDIKCVNCHQFYKPATNNNEACKYHPGNLRYFSCRGCGADAYYECCTRCIKCSKGCKVWHHCG